MKSKGVFISSLSKLFCNFYVFSIRDMDRQIRNLPSDLFIMATSLIQDGFSYRQGARLGRLLISYYCRFQESKHHGQIHGLVICSRV